MGKNAIIILVLSVVNWFPIIGFCFFNVSHDVSLVLLLLSFCSPFISVIYIITAVFFMIFRKFPNVCWGIIVIAINVAYLLWSRYYLDVLIHMT